MNVISQPVKCSNSQFCFCFFLTSSVSFSVCNIYCLWKNYYYYCVLSDIFIIICIKYTILSTDTILLLDNITIENINSLSRSQKDAFEFQPDYSILQQKVWQSVFPAYMLWHHSYDPMMFSFSCLSISQLRNNDNLKVHMLYHSPLWNHIKLILSLDLQSLQ